MGVSSVQEAKDNILRLITVHGEDIGDDALALLGRLAFDLTKFNGMLRQGSFSIYEWKERGDDSGC